MNSVDEDCVAATVTRRGHARENLWRRLAHGEAAISEGPAHRDRSAVGEELIVLKRAERCLEGVELVRATNPDVVNLLAGLQILSPHGKVRHVDRTGLTLGDLQDVG